MLRDRWSIVYYTAVCACVGVSPAVDEHANGTAVLQIAVITQ